MRSISISKLPQEKQKEIRERIKSGEIKLIPKISEKEEISLSFGDMLVDPVELCRYGSLGFAKELRRIIYRMEEEQE